MTTTKEDCDRLRTIASHFAELSGTEETARAFLHRIADQLERAAGVAIAEARIPRKVDDLERDDSLFPEGEGRVKMTKEEMSHHTETPWGEDMAHKHLAGGQALLLNGSRLFHTARILSEANYQYARHCVNSHDALLAAKAALEESINGLKRPHEITSETDYMLLGDITKAEEAASDDTTAGPKQAGFVPEEATAAIAEANLKGEHAPLCRTRLELLRDQFGASFGPLHEITASNEVHYTWCMDSGPGNITRGLISHRDLLDDMVANADTTREHNTIIDSLAGQIRDKDVKLSHANFALATHRQRLTFAQGETTFYQSISDSWEFVATKINDNLKAERKQAAAKLHDIAEELCDLYEAMDAGQDTAALEDFFTNGPLPVKYVDGEGWKP